MNGKKLIIFLLIVSLVVLGGYIAANGLNLGKYEIEPVRESINLGLDLEGGVYVVLEAQTDATGDELNQKMQEAKSIIDQRVNGLGVTEPNIVIESDNRIRVELPGLKNTQEALDMIGKTAELQFIDSEGNIIVTGKNVEESEPMYIENQVTGKKEAAVSLNFDSEGAELFREGTERAMAKPVGDGRIISIVLDGKEISAPAVSSVINNGEASIEGGFDIEYATELATLIRAGALPVEMEEVQASVIGPTLGLTSLDKSIYAGIIGIILIFIFMLLFYRIPGLVSVIALSIYIMMVLFTMVSLKATLTLPGIAGLILSIGMAVDANVVIFERVKEEIRAGKSLRSSVDSGFKKALSTVLDANITTLIAGIVLFSFGTGPIKGFAVTLIIGIIASMITAVVVTRLLLKLFIGMNITKNTKLFVA
ncbi:protein translocase subunit SecD [Clostridium sp. D2Q-11]|uniref:Protein translocase subunit SecD n=1 Tax=Anaeromonas frigoriresistens TaxID=2683708 RepID=A0A942UX31_9FIRM|nr:protein translocase subunit SecD [Anaeromonas frigoriresistens]MBS4539685.1 protein translocase subunit SecD [Anaeromonas frigoriresistens]